MNDGLVPGTIQVDVPTEGRPLSGLRLSVKDVIDVAGQPTGAGNPLWRSTHAVPAEHADVVAALLTAGAAFIGKSQTDELAYSLFGTNQHYGAPLNPAAPDRLTGGSSSGAASTVAAGLADIGLGTDTAGSIRVPASWCGLLGFRPSHSRVSSRGVVPLAPSFDVPGLITRDLATMRRTMPLLLDGPAATAQFTRLWRPTRLWPIELRETFARPLETLARSLESIDGEFPVMPAAAFAVAQGAQAWAQHGAWISQYHPDFGPGVRSRFQTAAQITPERARAAEAELAEFRDLIATLLTPDVVLVLPTTPTPGPLRDQPVDAGLRTQLLPLTTIAASAGLPALTLPVATIEGAPIGLCLLGASGTDEALLELAGLLGSTS